MTYNKDDLLYKVYLSEQSERFEDMVSAMKAVIKIAANLTHFERNLFSMANKNVIQPLRRSLRIVISILQKQSTDSSVTDINNRLTLELKWKIQRQIRGICREVLQILDKQLIPKASTAESKVFYYKMKGDYYRYLAETETDFSRKVDSVNSLLAYNYATDIANRELSPTHPNRLGLCLNFSVFIYEILNCRKRAVSIAENGFNNAINDLNNLSEENYDDAFVILYLLKENILYWTHGVQQN